MATSRRSGSGPINNRQSTMFLKRNKPKKSSAFRDSLVIKIKRAIESDTYKVHQKCLQPRGVPESKKRHIIEKLGPQMKCNRLKFFEDLAVAEVEDLIDTQ